MAAVLSGNRNFEGRINPDVKLNYLASPPLVVAYALAGTMDIDLNREPLGSDTEGKPVYLADIWPSAEDIADVVQTAVAQEMFTRDYADVFKGDDNWRGLQIPEGDTFDWGENSTYVRRPPYFDGMPAEPEPVTDITGAKVLALLGDSVTTDHISPAGAIKTDSPAGKYLTSRDVPRRDFNSYGSRRGNHEVMIRGTFANIRLRNQLAPGTEGGVTTKDGEQLPIYDASRQYIEAGTPLIVLGGKEYGSGSSRDWAAKGTLLLGVRAVLVESFERIHRSNLIGMGVLPLQYQPGESAASLGLTGQETFDIRGIEELNSGNIPNEVVVSADGKEFRAKVRIDTPGRGGVLPARRHHAVRAALAADDGTAITAADSGLVARLRAAGCVFAEDEARLLTSAGRPPAELAAMVERRAAGEPLEHVLGWAEFCGLRITVAPGVFVPRRRTEFLVARAVALARPDDVIVDLCCGAGAIGAALAAAVDRGGGARGRHRPGRRPLRPAEPRRGRGSRLRR